MKTGFRWQRRWAVGVALAVTAFIVVTDLLLLPMHARGRGQGLIAFADGLSGMLQFPGFLVAINAGFRSGHHTTTPVWVFIVVVNVFMWAVGARFLLRLLFPPARTVAVVPGSSDRAGGADALAADAITPETATANSTTPDTITVVAPPQPSRRRFLTSGVRLAAAGAGAVWGYAFLVETRWFEVTRRSITLRGLPASLDGLRIVQLTDIHHGPTLSLDYVRRVVDATNALDPDLILLTGDYVYRSPVYIEPVVAELSRLRGKAGVVGVLGNHDWWQDAPGTRRAFTDIRVPLIDNDRLFFTPDRSLVRPSPAGGEGLCVAGVGDYMEDVIRLDDALGGVPDGMPRLLLSHNPDVAEDTRLKNHRVDLMLCGHTHGGQCWVPGIGTPITASKYGSKYASGLVKGPACDVFISRGIGTTVLPLRFAIRPEISMIELHRA